MSSRAWWKETIVYQIYPRSFKDSNGDGVGDLQGILQQLDYIKSLGVGTVWLNPIYKSPNDDGGYDISDYYEIQPEFGTMEDFDELLHKLHENQIKLMMDLVLNHSSDEHPWFTQSRKSKENRHRNFYFWRPGREGKPPNNWPSFFGGSAWQLDPPTNEYYLHLFSKKQPDLNWEDADLRKEIQKLMKFWLDKGVDGLRLDVISAISKRTDFPDTHTADFNETVRTYYANGPRLKEFLREAKEKVWNKYEVVTVGEGPGISPENAIDYLGKGKGLDMIFHFGHMFLDQGGGGRFDPVPWTMRKFKEVFKTWDDTFSQTGWGSVFLGNHDYARMISRWGNDKEYWEPSAKLLLTLLLSMRGTPFLFQGDEIGMTNTRINTISDSKDIETVNGWREARKRGLTEQEFMKVVNYSGRDNARTPMQWTAGKEAGFTTGKPWMQVNENKERINVEIQRSRNDSILHHFRRMVAVRRNHLILTYGKYLPIETKNDCLFIFFRELDREKLVVALNFSDQTVKLPEEVPCKGACLITNYDAGDRTVLRPWEAVIYTV